MKCYTVFLALAASVLAQDPTVTNAPAAGTSGVLTTQQSCMLTCHPGDVTCQAACVGAAHPSDQNSWDTTRCSSHCEQGDGSPAATQQYAACIEACMNAYYPTSQTVGSYSEAPNAHSKSVVEEVSTEAPKSSATTTSILIHTTSPTSTEEGEVSILPGAASSYTYDVASAGLAGLLALFAF